MSMFMGVSVGVLMNVEMFVFVFSFQSLNAPFIGVRGPSWAVLYIITGVFLTKNNNRHQSIEFFVGPADQPIRVRPSTQAESILLPNRHGIIT